MDKAFCFEGVGLLGEVEGSTIAAPSNAHSASKPLGSNTGISCATLQVSENVVSVDEVKVFDCAEAAVDALSASNVAAM
ncbi:MAG: hypothetical protein E6Q34_00025 [Burkholderiaceae bacterium]|nr:MAG: hypothetical protein E6Q34_00025 [Burkholderiaceae bacterium]